jgi:pimeloyl-ACP methyl ester carboxylesterase
MLLTLGKRLLLVGLVFFWSAGSIASPQSEVFDARRVKVHYLIEGNGEPVVLIHGLYSSARVNWQLPGTLAALAQAHRVVALDLPGFGQSKKIVDDEAYGLGWVEDVTLLLDRLNIRKAHIVGYSMGGIVALKFIAQHPDRVISGTLGGMGWLPQGGMLQRVWEHMPQTAPRAVGQLALTKDELRAITTPVLVLVGDRDPIKQLYVAPLRMVRTDWPVVEIKGAGHLNCIFKEQFINEIRNWVDANHEKPATPG